MELGTLFDFTVFRFSYFPNRKMSVLIASFSTMSNVDKINFNSISMFPFHENASQMHWSYRSLRSTKHGFQLYWSDAVMCVHYWWAQCCPSSWKIFIDIFRQSCDDTCENYITISIKRNCRKERKFLSNHSEWNWLKKA